MAIPEKDLFALARPRATGTITSPLSRVILAAVLCAPTLGLTIPSHGAEADQYWDDRFFLTLQGSFSTYGIYSFLDLGDGRLLAVGDIGGVGDLSGTTGIAVWDGQRWAGLGSGLASGKAYAAVRHGGD